jgi:hypothetical protein
MRCEIRTLPLVALGFLLTACNLSLLPTTIPNISSANGARLPTVAAGSTVVLRGAGFGDAQGSGQLLFTPVGGGVSLSATVATWTQAVIVATVPNGAPGSWVVNVQSGNGITSGGLLINVTAPVTFSPSAVTWTAGPTLPGGVGVSGAGVAFAQIGTAGYVYVVGGAGPGGAPVATVSYASVNANGTLGAWAGTTSLPTPLAFPAAVAVTQGNSFMTTNGFVYVLGGTTDVAGTPVSTVYRAPFTTGGALGGWALITPLPAPLRSIAAVVQYGSLYVVGVTTTGAIAYRSAIQDPTANVPPLAWVSPAPLPSLRARFGFGVSGLYLYAFGGDGVVLAPNDTAGGASRLDQVVYAKINPSTGDIATSWTTGAAVLTTARSAHSAVLGAGNVLLTGGLYSGASTHTSEATYASVNADGTTGTFTTATPATSINSLCGCNLFDNGGTGYLAGNGTFHALIVGGDNVNAPGTPRAETFIY